MPWLLCRGTLIVFPTPQNCGKNEPDHSRPFESIRKQSPIAEGVKGEGLGARPERGADSPVRVE